MKITPGSIRVTPGSIITSTRDITIQPNDSIGGIFYDDKARHNFSMEDLSHVNERRPLEYPPKGFYIIATIKELLAYNVILFAHESGLHEKMYQLYSIQIPDIRRAVLSRGQSDAIEILRDGDKIGILSKGWS